MDEYITNVKLMRSDVNHVFLWLFVYNLIFLACSFLEVVINDWGLLSIIAVVSGNIMLFLVSRGRRHRICYAAKKREKMTPMAFISLICMLGLAQLITAGFSMLWTALGIEGTDIPMELDTLWVILYAGFIGPICEELSYRGFGKNGLLSLGVIPAILLSSLAFGLMHGNLSQFTFGLMVGLVMGYFCSRYGLIWTIIIHIFNNFVLATVPTLLPGEASIIAMNIADIFVYLSAVAAVVILIVRRKTLAAFLHDPENGAKEGWITATVSSVWFWIFTIIYIGIMVALMAIPGFAEVI